MPPQCRERESESGRIHLITGDKLNSYLGVGKALGTPKQGNKKDKAVQECLPVSVECLPVSVHCRHKITITDG